MCVTRSEDSVFFFLIYRPETDTLLRPPFKEPFKNRFFGIRFCSYILLLFQSECRIVLLKHSDENIVLQAVMDEFEENREKGNLTAELLNREKVTDLK